MNPGIWPPDPNAAGDVGFVPASLPPLMGTEHFTGLSATVSDFWAFAMPDLRTNNVRGYLAEFLVARAVGATGPRIEWDSYDVVTPTGVKLEVKSTARLQVWEQTRHSTLRFTGLRARPWTPQTSYGKRGLNADAYVFAVQTSSSHDDYDPLAVASWDFYVLPVAALQTINQDSLSLSAVQEWTAAVPFKDLGAEVERTVGRRVALAAAASRAIEALLPGPLGNDCVAEYGGSPVMALEDLLGNLARDRATAPIGSLDEVDLWLSTCSPDESYMLRGLINTRLAVSPKPAVALRPLDQATYRGIHWAIAEIACSSSRSAKENAHLIRAAEFRRLRHPELDGSHLLDWLREHGY